MRASRKLAGLADLREFAPRSRQPTDASIKVLTGLTKLNYALTEFPAARLKPQEEPAGLRY
jgi:hypothetical protein